MFLRSLLSTRPAVAGRAGGRLAIPAGGRPGGRAARRAGGQAEALYREMDRKDLAIELRMRLGDWFRVVQLLQSGGGDDATLALAWNKIGDYYADRQKWRKAAQYYDQAKNNDALAQCYYILEDFAGLERLAGSVPEGSRLLLDVGRQLESVGLGGGAVTAFLRAGDVKRAVDACVVLNQWDRAVELAETHKYTQVKWWPAGRTAGRAAGRVVVAEGLDAGGTGRRDDAHRHQPAG
jgi:hypothetical protein